MSHLVNLKDDWYFCNCRIKVNMHASQEKSQSQDNTSQPSLNGSSALQHSAGSPSLEDFGAATTFSLKEPS